VPPTITIATRRVRNGSGWQDRNVEARCLVVRTSRKLTLLKRQPFYALREGRAFDCGSKLGFLSANVAYALARPDLAKAVSAEIKKLL
jgi:hypothetical protein